MAAYDDECAHANVSISGTFDVQTTSIPNLVARCLDCGKAWTPMAYIDTTPLVESEG